MAKPLHFDAINPFTNKPFTWDDKNLRFIDGIGMYLEPSDPDFTPYPSVNQPTPKTKKMKRQAYYPSRIADQVLWLENFRAKILAYIVALGISAPQAAAIIADCRWLIYVLGSWLPAARSSALSCTDAATEAQTGTGSNPIVLPVFAAPPLPGVEGALPAVVPVAPGALNRLFTFVQLIKDSPGDTDAIDSDLRIVGAGITQPPEGDFQPVITATVNVDRVDLGWGWGGHSAFLDMLQLQVDRSDGKGFVDLAYDTTPNYTDTAPFPTALTKWTYRAIYHVNDAPIGQWSATVSVIVGG
jgi:hypothetical protein